MTRLSVFQIVSPPANTASGDGGITGPERRTANLAGYWRDRGIDVTVLYPRRGKLLQRFIDSNVPVVEFELRSKWDWQSVVQLAGLAKQHQIDIIHTQGGPALDLAAVVAAKLSGSCAVITRPVMIEDQIDRRKDETTLVDAIDRCLTLRGSKAVVAVSRNGLERLRDRMDPEKVHLIFNGVSSRPSSYKRELKPARLDVGMVGHLASYKGWLDFLAVASEVTERGVDANWHVVGNGPDRTMLVARAAELGIADRVVFHGLLQDVSPVLATLDIFLFTSHREGLSVAVLEAMSAELPIVATDIAGIRDQVVHEENGYVVGVRDVQRLAEHVVTLLKDGSLRRRLGQYSRERAERMFSQEAMLNGYAALYRTVREADG